MREQGDLSETTAIGLALGLSTQARLASSANLEGQGLAISTRAVETIKTLATVPNPSVAARRAYAEVLNMHGFLQGRNNENEAAIATLEEARRALASIDQLRMTDLSAAAAYAEATSWQVQSLISLGRGDEAQRAGKEGLAVAAQVLEKRPGHMQALRAQGLITSPLVSLLTEEMRLAEALALSELTLRTWQEFVRLDPGNTIAWNNLGVVRVNRNDTLQAMGRMTEAADNLRAGVNASANAPASTMVRWTRSGLAGRLAFLEADRGNRKEAEEALAVNRQLKEWLVANTPKGSFMNTLHGPENDLWRVGVTGQLGDYQRSLELGRVVAPNIERLQADDEEQRRWKDLFTRAANRPMSLSAYMLKDYPTAERHMARVLETRKRVPARTLGEKREVAYDQAWMTLILARLDRKTEAQQLIAPALKLQRELTPRNKDDPSQRLELALALYSASAVGLGEPAAQLAEAAALIGRLPPEMRQLRSTAIIRNGIADEQKSLRK
jgi:tetratricopeptide (TPR) repeat protein